MPASSEFSWTTEFKGPVFQVYGTKRKAVDDTVGPHKQFLQNEHMAKRPCLVEQEPENIQGIQANYNQNEQLPGLNVDAMQVNQQGFQTDAQIKVHPQLQQVHQVHAQRSPSPMPPSWRPSLATQDFESAIEFHHGNNNAQQSSVTSKPLQDDYAQNSATDHIMDLNDEVYDTSQASMTAQMAMDSDFVPDIAQYGARYADAMEQIISSPVDETSTPSMVKCFCRPSWEAYMSAKPYVSDYY